MTKPEVNLLGLEDPGVARAAWRILLPASAVVAVSMAIALGTRDAPTARFFDNVYWTVAYVAGALLAWLGVRTTSGRERAPRKWFAWALTLYAGGQALWDLQVAVGWNPFPGPSDLFFLCLGPLTGIGFSVLLLQGAEGDERVERRTAFLDSAGLSIAVLALTLALYLPRRGGTELLPLCFLVAYPVALCWAASTALTAVLARRLRPSRGLVLFLLGLFGNAALWLEWNRRTLDNALGDGIWLNTLFPFCALAQGLGVLLLPVETTKSKAWERFCEGSLRLLPLFIVVVCAAAVVLAFTLPHVPSAVRWSALLGGLVVVVVATVRQSLLLGERERLIAAERELRRAEETFRALVEQAADGIFITDTRGVYQQVNSRGAEMLGMTRAEVIGKTISDIVVPEMAPQVAPEVERLLRGETVHSSWLFRRKDGSTFHGEVTAKLLSDGRLQGFVRDVSDRVALEAQLRQSQKMEAVGVLSAGIAHDFNNILTAIRGNASLAAYDVGPTHPAAASIADIERAAERATELVQRILAFSRPKPPTTEQVNLATLVQEVVGLLRPTLPAGVELKATLPAVAPLVAVDPGQLHQVLMNLCTNAWQALGGKPGEVEIVVQQRRLYGDEPGLDLPPGNYAWLAVVDSGEGMSVATQERIFEPFFTTKAPGQGTGLGLSVAHSIVQGHGGALRVRSSPGQGSTFSIYLPVGASSESAQPNEPASSSRVAAGPRRVAYVDDESAVLSVMVRQLERSGYSVRGFGSAAEFLTSLREEPDAFDVVVTDYNMPKVSGLELIREAQKVTSKLGFVLSSGYLSEDLYDAASRLGVARLLMKPEALDRVCEAIDHAAASEPGASDGAAVSAIHGPLAR